MKEPYFMLQDKTMGPSHPTATDIWAGCWKKIKKPRLKEMDHREAGVKPGFCEHTAFISRGIMPSVGIFISVPGPMEQFFRVRAKFPSKWWLYVHTLVCGISLLIRGVFRNRQEWGSRLKITWTRGRHWTGEEGELCRLFWERRILLNFFGTPALKMIEEQNFNLSKIFWTTLRPRNSQNSNTDHARASTLMRGCIRSVTQKATVIKSCFNINHGRLINCPYIC